MAESLCAKNGLMCPSCAEGVPEDCWDLATGGPLPPPPTQWFDQNGQPLNSDGQPMYPMQNHCTAGSIYDDVPEGFYVKEDPDYGEQLVPVPKLSPGAWAAGVADGSIKITSATSESAAALNKVGEAFAMIGAGVAQAFEKLKPIITELATNIATMYGVPVSTVIGKTVLGTQADYVIAPGTKLGLVDVYGPSDMGSFFTHVKHFPTIGVDPALLKSHPTVGQLGSPLPLGHDEAVAEALAAQEKIEKLKAKAEALKTSKTFVAFDGSMSGNDGALVQAWAKQNGKNTCTCVGSGPDMDGPDIDCPVHGKDAPEITLPPITLGTPWSQPGADPLGDVQKWVDHYKQATPIVSWDEAEYMGTSLLSGMQATSIGSLEIEIPSGSVTPEALALAFGVPVEMVADIVSTGAPASEETLFDPEPDPVQHYTGQPSTYLWCDWHDEHFDRHFLKNGAGDPFACESAGVLRTVTPLEQKTWMAEKAAMGL